MTTFPFEQYPGLIDEIIDGIYTTYPELEERFGERGKIKCREDNEHHFNHLETAYLMKQSKIFTEYAIWLNNVLVSRGMKTEHLLDNFIRIKQTIKNKMDDERTPHFLSYLEDAINELTNH
ncbi:hypothetical protein JCM9140_1877 [Halalkalibacter wakoensis JCM 9140]|uniref:Uncharacterized protein n=1 Tax=Halalkalibacter wakoensis JCM 9140 TaxID=1236970 RepID=W4Q199_9BACI|nr:hypothetical protein [Halalkalibacter wakoensis]GAE25856.1 hypothetical protein JCM9140_1877 [Halalkalibacter wakoensis JCM 9140]